MTGDSSTPYIPLGYRYLSEEERREMLTKSMANEQIQEEDKTSFFKDAPIFEFFKRVWSQHGSEFINGLDHSDLPTNISYISTIVATTWLCVSCHLVSLPGKQGGATGALTRVQHKLVLAFKGYKKKTKQPSCQSVLDHFG